jgi:ubiquinone/menaquinone biosynthesis C-methylase UbiE
MTSERSGGEADFLDWIFDSDASDLTERYDRWASTYDTDHDEWGWRGPHIAAERLMAYGPGSVVLDAGCGTGRVGVSLRSCGFEGELIGVDFSLGMLAAAERLGVYDQLIHATVLDLPLAKASVDAVVSTGVFTHGHVGGEAFAELVRVGRKGAAVVITVRQDIADDLMIHADSLEAAGEWCLVESSSPQQLHPSRDESLQSLVVWRILESDNEAGAMVGE